MSRNVLRAASAAAMLLALVQVAHADLVITGVLSTGSHSVVVDSVTFMCGHHVYMCATPGWQGDSMAVDTFVFPAILGPPSSVTLAPTVDGSSQPMTITPPVADSWYVIPSTPTEAMVEFLWETGIEERGSQPIKPARLTVSPSIVGAGATIRAERAAGTTCVFEFFDALGNRVRTLVLRPSGAAASATWNGDDDRGRRLPEGIYYCRLNDAVGPAVRKLILAR